MGGARGLVTPRDLLVLSAFKLRYLCVEELIFQMKMLLFFCLMLFIPVCLMIDNESYPVALLSCVHTTARSHVSLSNACMTSSSVDANFDY